MMQGKLSQSSELNVCTHLQGEKETSVTQAKQALALKSLLTTEHDQVLPQSHLIPILGFNCSGRDDFNLFLFLKHTLQGRHCSVHRQYLVSTGRAALPNCTPAAGPPHTDPTGSTTAILPPPFPSSLHLQGTHRKLCSPVLHPSACRQVEKTSAGNPSLTLDPQLFLSV